MLTAIGIIWIIISLIVENLQISSANAHALDVVRNMNKEDEK